MLSKKEIALLYLRLAYFGTDKIGLENTLVSFSLELEDELSDEICASIIARLKYPEPKSYMSNKHALISKRTKYLLKLRNENGKYY